MNKLSLLAAIMVAFVLVGCSSVQDTINAKRNGVMLIVAEKVNVEKKEEGTGIGTGFFIADNEILTNAHVVSDSTKLAVKMEDGELYDAEIVKIDPVIDLALIKIKDWKKFTEKNTYSVLTLGDSSAIKPLDEVYALGNPWGLLYSVSKGVVSHPMRKNDAIPKFLIQTDAHVYEGNSGGPLLNKDGEVIGVNSLMLARTGGSYGFALHANIIKKVLADWKTSGEAKWATVGVSLGDDNVIKEVIAGSPAEAAGLKKDDKITNVQSNAGKYEVRTAMETIFVISETSSPDPIKITVDRAGEKVTVEVSPKYKLSSEFK